MEPLEEKERSGRSILNREDIKCIFGNVPEILSVHQSHERLTELKQKQTTPGTMFLYLNSAFLK